MHITKGANNLYNNTKRQKTETGLGVHKKILLSLSLNIAASLLCCSVGWIFLGEGGCIEKSTGRMSWLTTIPINFLIIVARVIFLLSLPSDLSFSLPRNIIFSSRVLLLGEESN